MVVSWDFMGCKWKVWGKLGENVQNLRQSGSRTGDTPREGARTGPESCRYSVNVQIIFLLCSHLTHSHAIPWESSTPVEKPVGARCRNRVGRQAWAACKPGSVRPGPHQRFASPRFRAWMAIHLDPPSPTGSRDPPGPRGEDLPMCDPYPILLPTGLAVPPPLPGARWALAPPFHPCHGEPWRSVLCGAFPRHGATVSHGTPPAGRYPASCLRGARTFLTPPEGEARPSDRPQAGS